MLRVTSHSSTWLPVVQNWEFIDSNRAEIISSNDMLSVLRGINSIDISTISTLWENTSNFPTKFTSGSLPNSWINEGCHTIWNLLGIFNIVEDLSIGLIDSSEEFGISGPIHTNDG